MALSSWTTQQVLNQLVSDYRWNSSVITYAFPTTSSGMYGSSELYGFSALNSNEQTFAELALTTWNDLIAPTFQRTTSSNSNLEFGMSTTGVEYAHTYMPTVSSIWFNTGYSDLTSPQLGQHGYEAYVHEIGHAIGLDHMGNYNGSGNWTPSCYQDSTVYSIMSYFGPDWGSGSSHGEGLVAWADWVGADGRLYAPQTPMLNDILAIQNIYGADTTTRTGDTVYGYSCNVTGSMAGIFNFSTNLHPILTIYDAGGNDTLNLSGWSTSSTINLAPGSFSSGNSMTNNIAIAYNCDIENAVGGSGADTINGNALGNQLDGSAGNDVINGLAGNDTLIGGSGDDTLDGGDGTDYASFSGTIDSYTITYSEVTQGFTITGFTSGMDLVRNVEYFNFSGNVTRSAGELIGGTFSGDAAANVVTGTSGDDHLYGYAGNDTLNGSNGNDTLDGGSGTDRMNGGYGNDTYIVDSSSDVITEMSGSNGGTDQVFASATFLLATFVENLTLTGSADINATGNSQNNVLTGNDGNNVLNGGTGLDTLIGGLGNDSYVIDQIGELATISENANEGNDTLTVAFNVTSAQDIALSGALAEIENIAVTGTGLFNLSGNSAANLLTGNSNNNRISGDAGNDTLNGGAGADTLLGGLGDDSYVIDQIGDTVIENSGEGSDTLLVAAITAATFTLAANVENATITSAAKINLSGNDLNNQLTGNAAANILDGGSGNDTLIGGGGSDTYLVDSSGDVIVDSSSAAVDIDTVISSVGWTLGVNLERLTLTGSGNLDGTGNTQNNLIVGNSGNNRLDGGSGADTLMGGAGNDIYVVDNSVDKTLETTTATGTTDAGGNDRVESSISWTLGNYIENLLLTGSANLNGTGNLLANVLTGNSGNNVLNGGAEADTMIGGLGNDTYVVDNVGDTLVENADEGSDTVNVALTQAGSSYTLGANLENATVTATVALNLTGNALDNVLTGNTQANRLEGGAGNDTLDGKAGIDTLVGGLGDDCYIVDNASDTIVENSGEGNDSVRVAIVASGQTYTLAANLENATVTSSAAVNLLGNASDNQLTGNAVANKLQGGEGNDTLDGLGGCDILNGGAGNDSFVFDTTLGSGNIDQIMDFQHLGDHLLLDHNIFTRLSSGALGSDQLCIGTQAADANDFLIYNSQTGALYYDADGNGALAAVKFATLTGLPTLSASDFTIV